MTPDVATDEEPTPRPSVSANKRRLVLLLPLVPLVLTAVAVWYFADLGSLKSPEKIAAAARALRESPLALPYVLLAFVLGTAVFFPVTVLMTGTVLAFDPLRGFSYAFAGTLLGAASTYWLGRLMGSRALEYASGPRMSRFGQLMRKHAIRASITARLLPVGNFTGINLFAGSLRIPFGSYLIGNMIGILPGALFLTFFAERLSAAVRSPSGENLTYLGVAVTLTVFVLYMLRRRGKQREAGEAARAARSQTREGTA